MPDLADAQLLCARLEPVLANMGYHCGILGSCAYRGRSGKDIDIAVYPHGRETKVDKQLLARVPDTLGFVYRQEHVGYDVLQVVDMATGFRVDFFFLDRPSDEFGGAYEKPNERPPTCA